MKKDSWVRPWHITGAFLVGVAITYLAQAADCATGGDCSFASGDLFNFFAQWYWGK